MKDDTDDADFTKRNTLKEDAIKALNQIDDLVSDARQAVVAAFEEYESQIDKLTNEAEDAKEELEEASSRDDGVTDAVNRFCDAVERPVGSLQFSVPNTAEVNRAITDLHDSIGRRL